MKLCFFNEQAHDRFGAEHILRNDHEEEEIEGEEDGFSFYRLAVVIPEGEARHGDEVRTDFR